MTPAQISRVQQKLAGKVICTRCGCTLETYQDYCPADLNDTCPGFVMIEHAAGEPSGQSGSLGSSQRE